jgi:hypothetical protein
MSSPSSSPPFRNHPMADNTGRIIAPHVQGLIWRETPGLRARCAQLVPGLAGADPLRLLAIREAAGGFAGAVGYLVKPPHHGCRLYQDMYGRFHHRGEARAETPPLLVHPPVLQLSRFHPVQWGGRGGVAHGAGGCRSAFPLSPAVIGLLALAGGWERRQHWFVAPH